MSRVFLRLLKFIVRILIKHKSSNSASIAQEALTFYWRIFEYLFGILTIQPNDRFRNKNATRKWSTWMSTYCPHTCAACKPCNCQVGQEQDSTLGNWKNQEAHDSQLISLAFPLQDHPSYSSRCPIWKGQCNQAWVAARCPSTCKYEPAH